VLHPEIALALTRAIRDDQLAAASRHSLASGIPSSEAPDFHPVRSNELNAEVIRFGRRYLREPRDLLAA